ncbi:hypothetical protein H7Y21_02470 [Arenimonas sp.]|nr:hypothetical protein [Candidatus Parcubacteria bacterium]
MFTILKKTKESKKKNCYNKGASFSLKQKKSQKGIALIIAITVMTLLLSISFSISNIVLRQIRITNLNNASKPAFFVADSAAECAFYYDILVKPDPANLDININEDFGTAVFGDNNGEIAKATVRCENKAPLNLTKSQSTVVNVNTVVTTFDVDYDGMCASVEVTKTDVSTKIVSRGYNTGVTDAGCDLTDLNKRRLVERGLTITY